MFSGEFEASETIARLPVAAPRLSVQTSLRKLPIGREVKSLATLVRHGEARAGHGCLRDGDVHAARVGESFGQARIAVDLNISKGEARGIRRKASLR